jgi:alpha-tubulin suppressor-like RCC1 family protein
MKLILTILVVVGLFLAACVQGQTHSTLAAGYGHFMEIKSGGLLGWGWNTGGQLGLGDNTNKPTPAPVALTPALSGYAVSVCAGLSHTCVLDSDKKVACSGADFDGQQGVGASNVATNVLVAVPTGGSDIAHLACGYASVHVTTTDGNLLAWGRDVYGMLGLGHDNHPVWVPEVCFC